MSLFIALDCYTQTVKVVSGYTYKSLPAVAILLIFMDVVLIKNKDMIPVVPHTQEFKRKAILPRLTIEPLILPSNDDGVIFNS